MERAWELRYKKNLFPVYRSFYNVLHVVASEGMEKIERVRNEVLYFYKGAVSYSEARGMPITRLFRLHMDLNRLFKKDGKAK